MNNPGCTCDMGNLCDARLLGLHGSTKFYILRPDIVEPDVLEWDGKSMKNTIETILKNIKLLIVCLY